MNVAHLTGLYVSIETATRAKPFQLYQKTTNKIVEQMFVSASFKHILSAILRIFQNMTRFGPSITKLKDTALAPSMRIEKWSFREWVILYYHKGQSSTVS